MYEKSYEEVEDGVYTLPNGYFVAEDICDHLIHILRATNKIEYLVKWTGYDESENTSWEPFEVLKETNLYEMILNWER